MGTNIAARRAAKAQRRKAIVAGKRKADLLAGSLTVQVGRAAGLPIQHCLLSDGLFNCGMGTLHVARGAGRGRFLVASFLLDGFCLGVKDAFCREYDGDQFAAYLQATNAVDPVHPVEPSYARKLLRELVAWSASQGYKPHDDFAALEGIFGTVQADDSDAAFDFGMQGRPVLIPGPNDTPTSLRRARTHPPGEIFQPAPDRPLALMAPESVAEQP